MSEPESVGMKRLGEGPKDAEYLQPGSAPGRPEEFSPVAINRVTRDYCKDAVRQLLGKPAYGKIDAVMIRVVIDAIHTACLNEGHVERTVGKLLSDVPEWPDVVTIRNIAYEMRDVEKRPNPDCPDCQGCGYKQVERLVKGWNGPETVKGSVRCDCDVYVKVRQS